MQTAAVHFILGFLSSRLSAALAVLGVALTVIYVLARRRESRRASAKLAEAIRQKRDVPPSLHPVVDPQLCIGCGSCVSACPEGRILGLVSGQATLVDPAKCIGHGRCASECPAGAIRLVFGTAERGVDLPEVGRDFETGRPGVHIVGELGGMGLIRNALLQGLELAAHLGKALDRVSPGEGDGAVDVAIVGAGPAGIATALGARAAGLSFAIFEQDTVGGAIAHYPRHKIVMTEPVDLPGIGKFGRRLMSKEELIATMEQVLARGRIDVQEKTKVVAIDGGPERFVVTTSRGALLARRVVLAIGRRGTPRRLNVPGEEDSKVAYRLVDPIQYQGRRVLVVGGGDAAVEAAVQLARESTATVSIAHRGSAFSRCRAANQQKLAALISEGRIGAFMDSEVAEVRPDSVVLTGPTGPVALQNDFVIACLGGELPTEFLQSVGVTMRRHHGQQPMPNPALAGRSVTRARGWQLPATFAVLGVVIFAVLASVGSDYYFLPRALRYRDPRHALLKPSGAWGHGVGILATLFMLSNFAYSVRKRVKAFKRRGPIAPWLRFHVFVGIVSPITILFHSAWQWGNQLATATYVALLVVMVTGLLGRFLVALVRFDDGHKARLVALRDSLTPVIQQLASPRASIPRPRLAPLMFLVADGAGPLGGHFGRVVFAFPRQAIVLRRALVCARGLLVRPRAYAAFRAQILQLGWLRLRMQLHRPLTRLLVGWRVLHVSAALILLGLIGLHVWASLRVGFKWPS